MRAFVRARVRHEARAQAETDLHAIGAQATSLAADSGGGGGDKGQADGADKGEAVRGRYPRMPVSKFGERLTTGPSFADSMKALGAADGMKYTAGQCRIFECYLAALFRRRNRQILENYTLYRLLIENILGR